MVLTCHLLLSKRSPKKRHRDSESSVAAAFKDDGCVKNASIIYNKWYLIMLLWQITSFSSQDNFNKSADSFISWRPWCGKCLLRRYKLKLEICQKFVLLPSLSLTNNLILLISFLHLPIYCLYSSSSILLIKFLLCHR